MRAKLEVLTLSVADVDRALAFYTDKVGFTLDIDYHPNPRYRHKAGSEDWQGDWLPGIEPEHRAYASVAEFADPDGNTWLVQEVGPTS